MVIAQGKMRSNGLAAVLLVQLAIALVGCARDAPLADTVRPAIVARAMPASSATTETYAGEVRARFESTLAFRVSGKIAARRVDVGAKVKNGDVIATLEAADFELAANSASAAVASASADSSLAKAELERHQELLAKKYISQALYDARLNAWRAAQARLTQAQSQLAVARNQAGYTELRAGADGVITAIDVEAGQVVAAGAPVATLAHDGDREVLINVPENRVAGFRAGMPVRSEIWAQANARYDGEVREIAPAADPQTRTYDVRVTLHAGGNDVQLGMTARVYLAAGDAPQAVLIPLSALAEKNDKPAVWIVDGRTRRVRLAPVEIGAYREEGVTVLTGLDAGEWVIAAGVHKLAEGQEIRPVDRGNRVVVL